MSVEIISTLELGMVDVVLGLLSTLTGGLPTIHIDPTKGNTKLRQVANLNEAQVYPTLIY